MNEEKKSIPSQENLPISLSGQLQYIITLTASIKDLLEQKEKENREQRVETIQQEIQQTVQAMGPEGQKLMLFLFGLVEQQPEQPEKQALPPSTRYSIQAANLFFSSTNADAQRVSYQIQKNPDTIEDVDQDRRAVSVAVTSKGENTWYRATRLSGNIEDVIHYERLPIDLREKRLTKPVDIASQLVIQMNWAFPMQDLFSIDKATREKTMIRISLDGESVICSLQAFFLGLNIPGKGDPRKTFLTWISTNMSEEEVQSIRQKKTAPLHKIANIVFINSEIAQIIQDNPSDNVISFTFNGFTYHGKTYNYKSRIGHAYIRNILGSEDTYDTADKVKIGERVVAQILSENEISKTTLEAFTTEQNITGRSKSDNKKEDPIEIITQQVQHLDKRLTKLEQQEET